MANDMFRVGPHFQGKSVSIDLGRVVAFDQPQAPSSAFWGRRCKLRITLQDGSDVFVEGDEDADGFITAMDSYLGSA